VRVANEESSGSGARVARAVRQVPAAEPLATVGWHEELPSARAQDEGLRVQADVGSEQNSDNGVAKWNGR